MTLQQIITITNCPCTVTSVSPVKTTAPVSVVTSAAAQQTTVTSAAAQQITPTTITYTAPATVVTVSSSTYSVPASIVTSVVSVSPVTVPASVVTSSGTVYTVPATTYTSASPQTTGYVTAGAAQVGNQAGAVVGLIGFIGAALL